MDRIKLRLKKLLGNKLFRKLGEIKFYFTSLFSLIWNIYRDGKLYYKHSMVFKRDKFNKIESHISLLYLGLKKNVSIQKL